MSTNSLIQQQHDIIRRTLSTVSDYERARADARARLEQAKVDAEAGLKREKGSAEAAWRNASSKTE